MSKTFPDLCTVEYCVIKWIYFRSRQSQCSRSLTMPTTTSCCCPTPSLKRPGCIMTVMNRLRNLILVTILSRMQPSQKRRSSLRLWWPSSILLCHSPNCPPGSPMSHETSTPTTIVLLAHNTKTGPIQDLVFQAAVPKSMSPMLAPPSSPTMLVGGHVTQQLQVNNPNRAAL